MYYQFLLTVLPGFAAAHATFRASTANTRQVTPRADPPNPPEPPVEALVNFANGDGECNDEQKKTVRVEMAWARAMAQAAVDNTQHGGYFDHFFPEKLRKEKDFAAKIKDRFSRIADVAKGTSSTFHVTVTCNQQSTGCRKKGWFAHMNDRTQVMNFCDKWFQDSGGFGVVPTSDAIIGCDHPVMDLRYAQRAMSSIIVHEIAHTSYAMNTFAMNGGMGALDIAYGYNACTNLSMGTWDRSCAPYKAQHNPRTNEPPPPNKILCPHTNVNGIVVEGPCDPELSGRNADTYSFVAAGVFFSKRCKKTIPHPQFSGDVAHTAGGMRKRAIISSCSMADFVVWDGDDESEETRVVGYAHFGDSYASGMGTGTTTTDACRIGSNNYGDLLYRFLNDTSISYDGPLSCSGDTTTELMQKIDKWNTANQTSLATVTIGWNDLGFSDLVWYCVITPNTYDLGYEVRNKCVNAQKQAFSMILDTGKDGFKAKLKAVYLAILRKAHHAGSDLMLYIAGYPDFFNVRTEDCNYSSFHYWWGRYKPAEDWPQDRIVHLTRILRNELGELTYRTNKAISEAVEEANVEWGETAIRFINVANAFSDGVDHRWCANETVHEPHENRDDTWFFLSGWKDVSRSVPPAFDLFLKPPPDPATAQALAQDAAEANALGKAGKIDLPNADSCKGVTASSGSDPWLLWQCRMSEIVSKEPDGPAAKSLRAATDALGRGELAAQNISWWLPTRQIKTFHPRTIGMMAYRDAIVHEMQLYGQI